MPILTFRFLITWYCPCIKLELENKKLKEELFAARLALVDQNNVIVELKNMLTISKKQIAKNVKSFSERKLEYEREIKQIKSPQEGDAFTLARYPGAFDARS